MPKMATVLKLVAGNFAALLLIFMSMNLLAGVILDVQDSVKRVFAEDKRANLPNYTDKDRAKEIFREKDQLDAEYVPYIVWSRKPYSGETTTINKVGDRVHAETTDSPKGIVRFFGGSSTWGSGTEDKGTLPARFNALYPNLKVHNHGESGFHTRPELARLINLVNQNEPMDLVIFYDGSNDAGVYCRAEVPLNGSIRGGKIQRRVHPYSESLNTLTSALLEVINGGFFKRHVFKTGERPTRCELEPEYTEEVAQTMLNNWRLARAVAAVAGADFIAVLQPVASVHSPRVDHLAPKLSKLTEPRPVYAHVRRLAEADPEIDWFYDLSNAFDGDQYIFIDHVHVSENGNDIMAKRIMAIADPILRHRGIVSNPAQSWSPEGNGPSGDQFIDFLIR